MTDTGANIAGNLTVQLTAPLDQLQADLSKAEALTRSYDARINGAMSKSGGAGLMNAVGGVVAKLSGAGSTIDSNVTKPMAEAAVKVESFAKSAEHATTSLALNRIQMLELQHVGRELGTMFAQGVDPMRVFTMESGRIATLLQMGNGGVGGSILTLTRIFGPFIAVAAAAGIALDAFKDKLNQGHAQALSFFDVLKGVGVTAFQAFTSEFRQLPAAISSAWDQLGTITGNAINAMIQQLHVWGIAIDTLLKEVPDYFAIAFQGAADMVAKPLNWMLDQLKKVLGLLALVPGGNNLIPYIAAAGPITAPDVGGASASKDLAQQDALYSQRVGAVYSTNYLGQVYKNSLPSPAATNGKGKASNPFDSATQSAKDATASLNAQAAALGKTAYETAQLEERTKLLNEATQKGHTLSPGQLQDIDNLSKGYATAKANLEALTQVYDLGKSSFEDFFSTLKTGFQNGETAIQAFGDAAGKVLDNLANKALQMAADGIWNSIFGSLTSGTAGGSGGGLLGALMGVFGGVGHFASGTSFAPGGSAIINETGPELVHLPRGAQVFNASTTAALFGAAANNGAANGNGLTVHIAVDARGAQVGAAAEMSKVLAEFSRNELPRRFREITANQYRRGYQVGAQ